MAGSLEREASSLQGFSVTIERTGGRASGLQSAGVGPAMTSPRIELVRVHVPTVANVGARSTTVQLGLSPTNATLFFHVPNPLLSQLSLPRVRPLSSRILLEGREAWVFSLPNWSFGACLSGDLPSRAEL